MLLVAGSPLAAGLPLAAGSPLVAGTGCSSPVFLSNQQPVSKPPRNDNISLLVTMLLSREHAPTTHMHETVAATIVCVSEHAMAG